MGFVRSENYRSKRRPDLAASELIKISVEPVLEQYRPVILSSLSDLELKPVGTSKVKLVQAKDLANKDIIGKSDPCVVVHIRPLADKMKKSKTINNQLNPIWNEHFEFIVEDASTQQFIVKKFDDEGVQASELIGYAQVSISTCKGLFICSISALLVVLGFHGTQKIITMSITTFKVHNTNPFHPHARGESQVIERDMRLKVALYISKDLEYCSTRGNELTSDIFILEGILSHFLLVVLSCHAARIYVSGDPESPPHNYS
ncbi:hypothetical protein C5167_046819 [Papaver somniferum]|uniref:C2 domain-containing protein n=1 Tax=Papaver somniferum TaxID=3469 RepID=A0A4Y7LEV9_PAPSO|nr:hypothetical protein C5167_046819 [Papaver somniferum]